MVLLEEEDVARLLLVDISAQDAQRRLVEAGRARRLSVPLGVATLPTGKGLLHEARHVVLTQLERLLDEARTGVVPRPLLARNDRKSLDDEAVICLSQTHLAHAALIEDRADRAQHFLMILA